MALFSVHLVVSVCIVHVLFVTFFQYMLQASIHHLISWLKIWVNNQLKTIMGKIERRCTTQLIYTIYVSILGEDRWMCTLMVQSGWRLEYCAASEDSTFCPDTFDEFFNQRRRWIPSTFINLIKLISEWKVTLENNDKISIFFILYQALLVCSTLIS